MTCKFHCIFVYFQGLEYILIGKTGMNESLHGEITGLTDKMEMVDVADDLMNDIKQFRLQSRCEMGDCA